MKLLRTSAILFLCLGFAGAAHAQSQLNLPKGNVSGFGIFTTATDDGLDGGHGGGGSGTYFFSRLIGVEGGLRFQSFDVNGTNDNNVVGGDMSSLLLNVNIVVRMASGAVQPYVTGGVVFFSNDYSTDPTLATQLAEFNFSSAESIDGTIGVNFGGGVDFQASRRVGFFVEGRYFAATADSSGGLTDTIGQITSATSGEQKLNFFSVAGGIRIFF